MPRMNDRWATLAPQVLSLFRILAALLLIQHGTQKFFSFPSANEYGTPAVLSLFGVAGLLELIGGGLLLIGLFTRIVAFILCGFMAVAYFMIHAPHSFYPIDNGGDLAVLFCFAFLYMSVAGGGKWSVDSLR